MKKLVGIVVNNEAELELLKPAREILEELNVPYDTLVLSQHSVPIEKLYLYFLTAGLKGMEVIIASGDLPCPVSAFDGIAAVQIIHVPLNAREKDEISVLPGFNASKRPSILTTDIGDAYSAGLWAVQTMASKHEFVHTALQKLEVGVAI